MDPQGHMKQKALPAGTAWALGGGVRNEKHVLTDDGPHLSVVLTY